MIASIFHSFFGDILVKSRKIALIELYSVYFLIRGIKASVYAKASVKPGFYSNNSG